MKLCVALDHFVTNRRMDRQQIKSSLTTNHNEDKEIKNITIFY